MSNLKEVGTLNILVRLEDFLSTEKYIVEQIEYVKANYIKKEELSNGNIMFTVKTYITEEDESIKVN